MLSSQRLWPRSGVVRWGRTCPPVGDCRAGRRIHGPSGGFQLITRCPCRSCADELGQLVAGDGQSNRRSGRQVDWPRARPGRSHTSRYTGRTVVTTARILLDRGEDSWLVVGQHVVVGRVALARRNPARAPCGCRRGRGRRRLPAGRTARPSAAGRRRRRRAKHGSSTHSRRTTARARASPTRSGAGSSDAWAAGPGRVRRVRSGRQAAGGAAVPRGGRARGPHVAPGCRGRIGARQSRLPQPGRACGRQPGPVRPRRRPPRDPRQGRRTTTDDFRSATTS